MASNSTQISQQIQSQLKVLIPDLSMDPLTPERKIIDTVSDVIASSSVDTYVLNYQFDIDTKVGSDLDKFVSVFGFGRQSAIPAKGTVTFSLAQPQTIDVIIAAGTAIAQPSSSISGTVTFYTTAIAIIPAGGTTADAPIICSTAGSLGNVPANTVNTVTSSGTTNITGVTNALATSNGADAETDAELRVRFKNTIFRNVSGTRDQFLALAIATNFSNQANVIGPISRYIEYVQIPPGLTVVSEIPYAKYTYNFDYYLTDGNFGNETFFTPNGVDYTFSNSVPASFTVNNTADLPVGSVVLLEHTYCSTNSRNDPGNNIANYVDVYVGGHDEQTATETVIFPGSAANFVGTSGVYDNLNYARLDGSNPLVGNRLQELVWQPLFSIPSVITISGINYFQGTHYWQVKDITNYRGSRRSRDGIEWSSTVLGAISAGTPFTMSYIFDKLPVELNELMDRFKQITSDVLVHSANSRYFNMNFIAMYTPGYNVSSVNNSISIALSNFLGSQQFGAIIQISDLLEIAHEVAGVDNIRLATTSDGVAYGIQEVAQDGLTLLNTPITTDFSLQDSDLPVLNRIAVTQKSQNTWTN